MKSKQGTATSAFRFYKWISCRPLILLAVSTEAAWLALLLFRRMSLDANAYVNIPLVDIIVPMFAILFLLMLAAFVRASRTPARADIKIILLFSVLFSLTLIARVEPLESTDLISYAFFGRVTSVYGMNPYLVTPAMLPHDVMRSTVSFRWQDWAHPYGPAWAVMSASVSLLGRGSPTALILIFKCVVTALFYGCLWVAWKLVRGPLNLKEKTAAPLLLLLAWNPAVLYETAQNGHNDMAMIFFLLLSVLLAARGRLASAGAAFAASVMMKIVSAVCLPALLIFAYYQADASRGIRGRLIEASKPLASFMAVSVALTLPFWGGGAALEAMLAPAELLHPSETGILAFAMIMVMRKLQIPYETIKSGVFAATRISFVAAWVGLSCTLLALKKSTVRFMVSGMVLMLVAYLLIGSAWLMRWYFIWTAPLLLVIGDAAGMLTVTAVYAATYFMMPAEAMILGLLAYWPVRRVLVKFTAAARPQAAVRSGRD